MVSRQTLRKALFGRDVAIAYAVIVALYLLKFIGFQSVQNPPDLLIVAYDFVEAALPFLTPYHPIGFPLFLYVLAVIGAAIPESSKLVTATGQPGCGRSEASGSLLERCPSSSAQSSVVLSSPLPIIPLRWRSPVPPGSSLSSLAGGYLVGRGYLLVPRPEKDCQGLFWQ